MKAVFTFVLFPSVLLLPLLIDASAGYEVAEIQLAESRAIIDAPNWRVDDDTLWAPSCEFGGLTYLARFAGWSMRQPEYCRQKCNDNLRCSHYTWFSMETINNQIHTNVCYLRDGIWDGNKPNDRPGSKLYQCGFILGRSWKVEGKFLWDENCNFDGQDIQGITNPTPNTDKVGCRKLCLENNECTHFTWMAEDSSNKNVCRLKKGRSWPGNSPTRLPNAQCGFFPGRSWWRDENYVLFDNNCDFYGQEIQGITNPTLNTDQADCRKMCLNNPLCSHFTWYIGSSTKPNVCYLKKGSWPGNRPTSAMLYTQCGRIPDRSFTTDGWTVDGHWKFNIVWKINCDFYGQGIQDPTPNINQEHCGKLCFENPKCDHFTWHIGDNTNKNVCYLRTGVWTENKPYDLPNARCGYIPGRSWQVDGKFLWDDNCDFGGQYLSTTPNTNRADCRKLCSDNPNCGHFTWWAGDDTNKNLCRLKQGNWDGNKPEVLANAQCGRITDRSWTTDGWAVDSPNLYWKNDCVFAGQDFASTPVNINQADCRKLCLTTALCTHFTWRIGSQSLPMGCYMKKGIWPGNTPGNFPNGQCGFISGRSWTADGWTIDNTNVYWKDNCDFYGNDMLGNSIPNVNQEYCGTLCFKNPLCERFTWYKDSCYLKTGVWSTNNPSALASAACGYIPGRSSWTTGINANSGRNCGFASPSKNYQNTRLKPFASSSTEDCLDKCYKYYKYTFTCTYFTFLNGQCYMRNDDKQTDTYESGIAPVYVEGATCGRMLKHDDH